MGKKNSDTGYNYYQEITMEGLVDVDYPKPKEKVNTGMKLYSYYGSVLRYGKCVLDKFNANTMAISEAKAKQNILYQAKKALNLSPAAGGFILKNNIVLTK